MRLPEEDFAILTGKTPADFRQLTWTGRARLIFATPEVVRNDLLEKRADLRDFGLLVFDECHRSVKEYAYTEIAGQYVKMADYPLILGMTASPGSDINPDSSQAQAAASACQHLLPAGTHVSVGSSKARAFS